MRKKRLVNAFFFSRFHTSFSFRSLTLFIPFQFSRFSFYLPSPCVLCCRMRVAIFVLLMLASETKANCVVYARYCCWYWCWCCAQVTSLLSSLSFRAPIFRPCLPHTDFCRVSSFYFSRVEMNIFFIRCAHIFFRFPFFSLLYEMFLPFFSRCVCVFVSCAVASNTNGCSCRSSTRYTVPPTLHPNQYTYAINKVSACLWVSVSVSVCMCVCESARLNRK